MPEFQRHGLRLGVLDRRALEPWRPLVADGQWRGLFLPATFLENREVGFNTSLHSTVFLTTYLAFLEDNLHLSIVSVAGFRPLKGAKLVTWFGRDTPIMPIIPPPAEHQNG